MVNSQHERAEHADFTRQNNRLESQTTTPETEALIENWVAGSRTIESVVSETRRKYGLA